MRAYARGLFPMAQSRHDPIIFWLDPPTRGIITPQSFHVPKRMRRTIRNTPHVVAYNTCFQRVLQECATPTTTRTDTWLNPHIMRLHEHLHTLGRAHSVEIFMDDTLVGGLYGITLGAAFFGESMFSRKRDASKIALIALMEKLVSQGFQLLDTQFITDHLRQFGAYEVERTAYRSMLQEAVAHPCAFLT